MHVSEKFVRKREPSSDLSDRDLKDKLQDSEDDSRKTTNYGSLRGSEERESSTERMFNHNFHKDRSLDREKRGTSKDWRVRGEILCHPSWQGRHLINPFPHIDAF